MSIKTSTELQNGVFLILVAEDQRTAYIGLVGGVLSIVVLLLGTGLVVYLRRRKNRHGKQVAAMLPGGSGLNKMPVSLAPSSDKRMTLLSLKQLGKANSLAPSARDGFYGPVMTSNHESDSDTSSFYHEPYQQQQQQQQPVIKYNARGFQRSYCSSATDPEYGCLIQKEPLVLTPKGLHSKGIYHKLQQGNGHPPTMPLPRPPLSAVKQSLLMADTSSLQSTTSFTAVPSENYYATTDLIHVSPSLIVVRRPESSLSRPSDPQGDRSVLKPLFEENSAMSGESEPESVVGCLVERSKSAFFTAPPPPPVQPQSQQSPAPPFPSRVSPYVIPAGSPVDGDLCPPDLGRHQIGLLEKLGEGAFSVLHFAELDPASIATPGCSGQRKCVFLRLIRTADAPELVRDVRRLSVLRDPSIAKVVAMATDLSANGDDVTIGLMTEYLEGGPLPIYLRQYRLGAADNFEPGVKTIR